MTCSMPMIDTDSIGVMVSLAVDCFRRGLLLLFCRRAELDPSLFFASLLASRLGASSIGVAGRGDAGLLSSNAWI